MTDVAGRRFRLASPATATALGALVLVLVGVTAALVGLIHQLTIFNVVTEMARLRRRGHPLPSAVAGYVCPARGFPCRC